MLLLNNYLFSENAITEDEYNKMKNEIHRQINTIDKELLLNYNKDESASLAS